MRREPKTALLDEHVAVVTGAGRGLGQAMAEALTRAGARTVLASRSSHEIEAVAEGLRKEGLAALAVRCDVTDPDQIEHLVDVANRSFGTISVLVNNAGNMHFGPVVPIPGFDVDGLDAYPQFCRPISDDEWSTTLDTHVTSAFRLVRAVGPQMLESGYGRIINITSVSVIRPARFTVPYDCAKSALAGLTRSLAKEWARCGVTVNAIAPGQFKTSLSAEMHESPKGRSWLRGRIPMRRTGEAHEIGPLCVYLASPSAGFVTGQVFPIDGGESL